MKKNIEQTFKSTSMLNQYIDNSLGYAFKTRIFYKFGEYNSKPAVGFYIDRHLERVRTVSKSCMKKDFRMYRCGGQTLHSSRRQREKCLELVVRSLFEHYGFNVSLNPNLNHYQPDMLANSKNFTCYIEFKAYYKSYICGDPEISQIMKYFKVLPSSSFSNYHQSNSFPNLKFILITSGSLIGKRESFLQHPNRNPIDWVSSFYKDKGIPRSRIKTLEDFSSRDIYKQAAGKFKRNYGEGFPPIKVVFFEKNHVNRFPSCLFSEKFDILLLGPEVVREILEEGGLKKEARKFNLLRTCELERIVIDGSILKI